MNMALLLSVFSYFLFLCLTAECQESLQLLPLQPPSAAEAPPSAAVHVEAQHLKNVSGSVLAAEDWLRNHVLTHYPATNITTIVVGCAVLCNEHQHHLSGLILPSVKNLHYSLTRWGLQEEIRVSAAFSSGCLDSVSETYRGNVIKPLLVFLQEVSSPYVVQPPHVSLSSPEERLALQKSHTKSMKNLGVSEMNKMNMIVSNARRKLSSNVDISNSRMNPFPPRPAPVAPVSPPAFAAGSPLPPLVGFLPPQPSSPQPAPVSSPPYPQFGPHLPPCNPSHSAAAPTPSHHGHGHGHGTWCVAKPSVPADTLQEALDFACGEGSVDCEAIKQDGSCYYPDTVVAHASYAFNSYWQKTKRDGGTCGFGGTAMIITTDPSYGHCRFTLT